jgi:hypothetical protein
MKTLAVALFMPICAAASLAAQDEPLWHADWPTAQRIAAKANKPIFAVFVCKH